MGRLRVSFGVAAILAAACGDPRPAAPTKDPCSACHGDPARAPTALNPQLAAAPPASPYGSAAAPEPGAGPHLAHLQPGPLANGFQCQQCHLLPTYPRHPDGVVQLTFGNIATAGGALTPTYDFATRTCSSVYCHGSFRNGAAGNLPVWNGGASEAACGSCHGLPPGGTHPPASGCGGCHPGYTASTVTVDLHVNGRIDFGGTGSGCASCHGAPPASGAHLVHYGDQSSPSLTTQYGDTRILQDYYPAGAAYYVFGCGNCHPLDPAKHFDGIVEVELAGTGAPPGSLKSRNPPAAAYDPATKTCSGVYCHGSGQDAAAPPTYAVTPAWDGGQALGCGSCHGNPPRYPSAGAGTAGANTHLVLADDGYELGHFAGLPGPWHTSYHGAPFPGSPSLNAGPITCQTCHAATVDPSHTGPSGFYYLDTSGDYQLPGGLLGYSCGACHTGAPGAPPVAGGKVLPLRHVNGQRNVVFDSRAVAGSLPGYPGAPASANTRPYWVVLSGSATPPPGAIVEGTTWSASLANAAYDPATKTCSNVACHLQQTSVRWGLVPVGMASCDYCHQYGGVPPPP